MGTLLSGSTVKGLNGIEAQVILGSTNVWDNTPPIYTFRIRFHRYVAEQLLKHRMFSLNATSSRAMSVPKMNSWIDDNPAEPIFWGGQQKGMQPTQAHEDPTNFLGVDLTTAELWESTRGAVMDVARSYWDAGYHQQIPNRLTHAFQMAEYVLTATDLDNFFNLRLDESAAQSEITELAKCMKQAIDEYTLQPTTLRKGVSWHLPYVTVEELEDSFLTADTLQKISAARCAIVSYNNHESDELLSVAKAVKIYNHLVNDKHLHGTPLEHSARALAYNEKRYVEALEAFEGGPTRIDGVFRAKKLRSVRYFANFNMWISQRYLYECSIESQDT